MINCLIITRWCGDKKSGHKMMCPLKIIGVSRIQVAYGDRALHVQEGILPLRGPLLPAINPSEILPQYPGVG